MSLSFVLMASMKRLLAFLLACSVLESGEAADFTISAYDRTNNFTWNNVFSNAITTVEGIGATQLGKKVQDAWLEVDVVPGLKLLPRGSLPLDATRAVALAEAGVNLFAHLVRDKEMSDELIATMVKNKVYVNPNLGAAERNTHAALPDWADEPYLSGLLRDTVAPEVIARIRNSFSSRDVAEIARSQQQYAILKRSLAKLSKAGARIILGADTGLRDHIFGYAEQKELEFMVDGGMTPSEVIVAATRRAAEFIGLTDRGTLTPGKRADLLVLDANPLDDIRNTRRISKLYLAGIEVDRPALKESLTRPARN